jgi:hypothetical protein
MNLVGRVVAVGNHRKRQGTSSEGSCCLVPAEPHDLERPCNLWLASPLDAIGCWCGYVHACLPTLLMAWSKMVAALLTIESRGMLNTNLQPASLCSGHCQQLAFLCACSAWQLLWPS